MPSLPPSLRKKDQYSWAIGGFLLVAGISALMGLLRPHAAEDRWSPSDAVDSDVLPLSDQPGAIRAPGGPLQGEAGNSKRLSPENLIEQGGPIDGENGDASAPADGAAGAGDNLSQDGRSDSIGKKPADASGWNGEAARGVPGLNVAMGPKPTLAPMGGFGGGGGGGSGASGGGGSFGGGGGFSSGATPFGSGHSLPGQSHTIGLGSSTDRDHPHTGGGASLDQLRQVASSAGNARKATEHENAWGSGAKSFDGAVDRPTLVSNGGSDTGVGIGSSVPGNLKSAGGGGGGGNAGDNSSKSIQPPPPGQPKPVNTDQNQMSQMMMMMLMSTMLSGVAGAAVKVFFP